jgi:hypothetical protein
MKKLIVTALVAISAAGAALPATASATDSYHRCPRPDPSETSVLLRNGAPRNVTCQTAATLEHLVATRPLPLVSWQTVSGIRWNPQFFFDNTNSGAMLGFYSPRDLPNGADIIISYRHGFD